MPRIKFAMSQSFALDQSSITASRFSAGAAADPAPRSVQETSKRSRGSTPGVLAGREQATHLRRCDGGVDRSMSSESDFSKAEIGNGHRLFAGEWIFLSAAGSLESLPRPKGLEVALAGRSNVGKSSLINALTGRRSLARTSNTPGRTQELIFFGGSSQLVLVDLPGYGYARAPRESLRGWKRLIEHYLEYRESLKLCCLILDARRGWMAGDLELKHWLEAHTRPYLVIATKTDKANQSEQQGGFRAIREEGVEPLPFSAVTGRGVRTIWQAITTTLQPR